MSVFDGKANDIRRNQAPCIKLLADIEKRKYLISKNDCSLPKYFVKEAFSFSESFLKRSKHVESKIPDLNNNSHQPAANEEKNRACVLKEPDVVLRESRMQEFLNLLDGQFLSEFLNFDPCYIMTDSYLVAVTFRFMEKCVQADSLFTPQIFFQCLFIACALEEDDIDLKHEVFGWFQRESNFKQSRKGFVSDVRSVMKKLDYKLVISDLECLEVMALSPSHNVWKRKRTPGHAMVIRDYKKDFKLRYKSTKDQGLKFYCYHCAYYKQEAAKAEIEVTPAKCRSVMFRRSATFQRTFTGTSKLGSSFGESGISTCTTLTEYESQTTKNVGQDCADEFEGTVLEGL